MQSTFVELLSISDNFRSMQGATEEMVQQAEQILGLFFAKDYREYLKKYGVATVKGHEFTGLGASKRLSVIETTMQERTRNISFPENSYVVELCNIDGIMIIQTSKGKVFGINQGASPIYICDSLVGYLKISNY